MSASETLSPQVIQRVLREIRDLNKNPPDGITYQVNDSNSVSEVHAIIKGPEGTPYSKGSFRMKLILSHEYPGAPPKGYFLTKIYHPNVASNGDICVNTLKKDWNPDTTLKHVLQVIRCLLIVPFPESSLNDEAGKLFMDDYEDFARRAELMTNVHATDDEDENDELVEKECATSTKSAGKGVVKADEGSTEENIVPTENSSHSREVKDSTEGSGKYDKSMDAISSKGSAKKATSSKESSKKSKEKDIKKKSLKRL